MFANSPGPYFWSIANPLTREQYQNIDILNVYNSKANQYLHAINPNY